MVMHIRKPENEGTFLGNNEVKNWGKDLKKIEASFAQGK